MRTLLTATVAAIMLLALPGASPAKHTPNVDYCDILITRQGHRVFLGSFGARLAPLAHRPRCGSTYPLHLSGCYFSPEHLTWVRLVWTPWTGPYYQPC
jgi:hypothetical protein